MHPTSVTGATVVAFATNKGRVYAPFQISNALFGCHFALYMTAGAIADAAESYIIPCRKTYGE